MTKEKTIDEYKLGEEVKLDHSTGAGMLLRPPLKLVRIGYTIQDVNGSQMEIASCHNDYIYIDEEIENEQTPEEE